MDPALIKQLALGTFPPGLAAMILFAALWRKSRTATGAAGSSPVPDPTRAQLVATPLILAAIYIMTHHLILSGLTWPPRGSTAWLPYIAAAMGLLLAIASVIRPPWGWGLRALALGFAAWASTRIPSESWSVREQVAHLGSFLAIGMLAGFAAERACIVRVGGVGEWRRGFFPILVLVCWAGAVSQLLGLGFSSIKLSQTVGIVAASLGGAMTAAVLLRNLMLARAGMFFAVAFTLTGVLHGVHYASATRPILLALLAAGGPVMWLMTTRILPKSWKPALRGVVEIAMAVLPVAVAIAMALMTAEKSEY